MHSAVATSKETEVNVRIMKRDNQTLQDWIPQKLERAIRAAAADAKRELGKEDMTKLIRAITKESISQSKDTDNIISVDDIQKIVKKELMELKYHEVAEAYILYSNKRDEARKKRLETNPDSISDYIQCTKYARYIQELQRRETYKETNDRSRNMHIKKYPQITNEINEAFDLVDDKYVLPSMRARQFGGKAIETNHTRIYNCSFSVCNRPRFFAEGFYLLLCGTGTGFSVQWKHVDQLPELSRITKNRVKHHVIEDTIEGWADALDALVHSYFNGGEYVEFAYYKIRPFGSELKISGGKAPGHLPLKEAIDNIRGILDKAQGRQLKPIECYDMMCMAADAVYAGGIREAAMICLFSIDDGEMMNSKTGNWFPVYPWRQRSNNSVVLKRNEIRKAQFDRIFKATKEWGEPGFYFTDDEDTGSNPCCLTGDMKLLTKDGYRTLRELWAKGGFHEFDDKKIVGQYGSIEIVNDKGIVNATNVYRTSECAEVFKVILRNGIEIKATENHKFILADNSRKMLKDLSIGDEIPFNNQMIFSEYNDPNYARLAGWVIGDGAISYHKETRQHRAHVVVFSHDIENVLPVLREDLLKLYNRHNKSTEQYPQYEGYLQEPKNFNFKKKTMNSIVLGRLLKEDGIIPGNKHQIPKSIWGGNKETIAAFLQGLFSADGSVQTNDKKKCISIRLAQVSKCLLNDIQILLNKFGIASSIRLVRKARKALMNDGKGGKKFYNCKDQHELIIGGINNCKLFMSNIKFIQDVKNLEALNWFDKYHGSNNSEIKTYSKIKSISYFGVEETFCLTESKDSQIVINAIKIGQCEIGLNPKLEITPEVKIFIDEYFKKKGDKKKHSIKIGDVYWGWQFCNLSEVNAAKCKTKEQLFEAVRAASIIGTVQAGYTDLDYLGWISEVICMRESLLGVSMTGIMDNPDIALDPEIQKEAAQYAVVTNIQISRLIGINSAARVTTVKPSGTASLVLGCVGSGIHPHHARRYFRRIRATPGDPIYEMFKANNPHMCTAINDRKEMITFTIKAPDGALVRHDLTAIQFLKHVLSTQKNWVMSGTARPNSSPKLTHNVSNTITVKQHEWKEVAEFLWENKQYFSGVSLLSDFGDKIYANAPREEVKTEADEAKWQQIISQYKEVKWVDVKEEFDNTNLQGEAACAGGSCDLKL